MHLVYYQYAPESGYRVSKNIARRGARAGGGLTRASSSREFLKRVEKMRPSRNRRGRRRGRDGGGDGGRSD